MADPVTENIPAVQAMLRESAEVKRAAADSLAGGVATFARWVREAVDNGGKVLLFGNGGSMCDAMHIAEELVGRYRKERRALPAMALGETSLVTCIANDYGYEAVFSRQVEAWARPGDIVVGLSTSGRSPNVLAALRLARERGARTIALTGEAGLAEPLADLVLAVPSANTARIQECHITIGHIVCELVEGDM
jgi:D-sedoheptulose 7-phosphate isomerase